MILNFSGGIIAHVEALWRLPHGEILAEMQTISIPAITIKNIFPFLFEESITIVPSLSILAELYHYFVGLENKHLLDHMESYRFIAVRVKNESL